MIEPHRRSRPAFDWLADERRFDALADRARELLALQADVRRILGRGDVIVTGLDGNTLMLEAPSAALAARLRQSTPSIVRGLDPSRWAIREIRIRPSRSVTVPGAPRPKARPPIPESALEALGQIRDACQGSPLAERLARLLAHARSKPRP